MTAAGKPKAESTANQSQGHKERCRIKNRYDEERCMITVARKRGAVWKEDELAFHLLTNGALWLRAGFSLALVFGLALGLFVPSAAP